MMDNHKILVVEDDMDLREALCDTLEMAEYCVVAAESAERALQELALHSDIHMIVSDVNMGGMSGHELLVHVRQQYAHIPMLLVTAYASVSDSVEAMRLGAVDYLVKPFQPKLLLDTVAKYVKGASCDQSSAPVAESESSQQLLRLASRVAQTDSTVLVVGESGTGKEVLARYVHEQSPRANKPFIAINCAAIPENMLEAMLFGHEKGAYTGATSSAPGKFEQANGGTLLLDEISELDLGLQAKLLRVLQEKEVERLGGRKTIKLDVRVIATSNRDMRHYVAEGKFREDLYYRLSVLPLQWAPLRDRKEDIIPLANKLLQRHAEKQHRRGIELTASAQETMLAYAWPGNVRELDNVMQRALILQPGSQIAAEDLGLEFANNYSPKPSILPTAQLDTAAAPQEEVQQVASPQELKEEVEDDLHSAMLGDDLKRREFEIIVQTLKQEGGSKKNTAGKLGISPRTLRYKIARFKDLGLNVDAQLAC
ncbi:MAG: sigma-54 dependent transcriptional regulator [Cellvibrionaceae bacterium]|nr:sigma-54 dependent transcriptional regulator [Cellvibrionaceae bacterium]